MAVLYLQDAVTQIRSHMPPEGLTAPTQVPLKTPHTENILNLNTTNVKDTVLTSSLFKPVESSACCALRDKDVLSAFGDNSVHP